MYISDLGIKNYRNGGVEGSKTKKKLPTSFMDGPKKIAHATTVLSL